LFLSVAVPVDIPALLELQAVPLVEPVAVRQAMAHELPVLVAPIKGTQVETRVTVPLAVVAVPVSQARQVSASTAPVPVAMESSAQSSQHHKRPR